MVRGHALVVGAMKAGTTALYHLLTQHPAVAACREKEPNALNRLDVRGDGLRDYAALWEPDPARHAWLLEASTAYTKLPIQPSAAPFLGELGTEYRVIYVVRDPLARIRSHYLHGLVEGWIRRPIHAELNLLPVYFSNYHFQLRPYEDFCPADRVLVLRYEDLRADPVAAARRCLRFLELDPGELRDPGPHNAGSDYRVRLLAMVAVELGLVAEVDPRLVERGRRVPELLQWLAEHTDDPHPHSRVAELVAETDRRFTPSGATLERVHELLDEDLRRFTERTGIDPWDRVDAGATASGV